MSEQRAHKRKHDSDAIPSRRSVFERLGAHPTSNRPVNSSLGDSYGETSPAYGVHTNRNRSSIKIVKSDLDQATWTSPSPSHGPGPRSSNNDEDDALLQMKRDEIRKELEYEDKQEPLTRSPLSLNRSGSSCSASSSSFYSSQSASKTNRSSYSDPQTRKREKLPPNVIDPHSIPLKYDRHGNVIVPLESKRRGGKRTPPRKDRGPNDLPPCVRRAEEAARAPLASPTPLSSEPRHHRILLPTPHMNSSGPSVSNSQPASFQASDPPKLKGTDLKLTSNVSSPLSESSFVSRQSSKSRLSRVSDMERQIKEAPVAGPEKEAAMSGEMSPISDGSSLSDFEMRPLPAASVPLTDSMSHRPAEKSVEYPIKSVENFSDWSDDESEFPSSSLPTPSSNVATPSQSAHSANNPPDEVLEEISDDELDAVIGKAELNDDSLISIENSTSKMPIIDVLDIDWNELHKDRRSWQEKKRAHVPGAARKRLSPASVLATEGFSQKFAGPDLSEKISELCQRELGTAFRGFLHPCGLMHKIMLQNYSRP